MSILCGPAGSVKTPGLMIRGTRTAAQLLVGAVVSGVIVFGQRAIPVSDDPGGGNAHLVEVEAR